MQEEFIRKSSFFFFLCHSPSHSFMRTWHICSFSDVLGSGWFTPGTCSFSTCPSTYSISFTVRDCSPRQWMALPQWRNWDINLGVQDRGHCPWALQKSQSRTDGGLILYPFICDMWCRTHWCWYHHPEFCYTTEGGGGPVTWGRRQWVGINFCHPEIVKLQ